MECAGVHNSSVSLYIRMLIFRNSHVHKSGDRPEHVALPN